MADTLLDDLLDRVGGLPPAQREEIERLALLDTAAMPWVPNPGPQTAAFYCEADELLFGGAAGGGKALDVETPIPTPSGWTRMGDLAAGDAVFDDSGHQCRVVATSSVMLGRPCYRVTFSDSAEVVADRDHRWFTMTAAERIAKTKHSAQWRARRRAARPSRGTGKRIVRNACRPITQRAFGCVRTTQEISRSIVVRGGRVNHAIEVAGAIECPAVVLPIDPYLLGAWLGDGTSLRARLTIAEPEMAELATAAAKVHGWSVVKGATRYDYGVPGGLLVALRTLGLLGKKVIPSLYLRASVPQRLALLQGLMDTDGYADDRGHCEYTSTSLSLANSALELIVSLGIKAALSEGRAKIKGRDCGPKYRIKFLTELPAFRLTRKLARQKRNGFRGTSEQRYIVAVQEVESRPVKCIAVDSPTRLFLSGRAMVPTHNSDLLIGLALANHQRSRILRRVNLDVSDLGDRLIEILGNPQGYNSQRQIWKRGAQFIEFKGCEQEKDKQRFKGKARDFIGYDELADFLESQYVFINTWNRSNVPGQRCRVVGATNGPTTAEGQWVVRRWAAWLDPNHPTPAKDGELRWYAQVHGQDIELPGPGEHDIPGLDRKVSGTSRTFIRSWLKDNPDLARTDYGARLDSLPEELRRVYKDGDFTVGLRDDEFQVIPTAWVEAAMQRWTPQPPKGFAMTAMAVDIAEGGGDETVLACRYGGWYGPLVVNPGAETKEGYQVAGLVVRHRKDRCPVIPDVGGGYGADAVVAMKDNGIVVYPFNGVLVSTSKSRCGHFMFRNKRAEAWWRLREELNPEQEGGSVICLPPDPELKRDLAAPHWENTRNGILIEDKADIKKRLGRSPDRGDAVVMALAEGDRAVKRELRRNQYGPPRANLGHSAFKRGRRGYGP